MPCIAMPALWKPDMPISPPAHYVNIVGEACATGILSSCPRELPAGQQALLTLACFASAVTTHWWHLPRRPGHVPRNASAATV